VTMRRAIKSKIVNSKSDSPDVRGVWHFIDYRARFGCNLTQFAKAGIELAKFLRWPINAWRGPEGDALRCMNYLRAEKEYIWLKGCLAELLEAAANTDPEVQGYLLTSQHEPAEASNVGSMLRVDGRKALAVLTRLETAGFLERVPWPLSSSEGGPPSSSDGPILDDPSLRLLRNVAQAGKKTAGKRDEKDRSRAESTDKTTEGRGQKGRFRVENAGGSILDARRLCLVHLPNKTSERTIAAAAPKPRFCNENADDALKKHRRSEITAAQQTIEVTAGGRDAAPDQGGASTEAAETPEAVNVVCPKCGNAGKVPKLPEGHTIGQCSKCGTKVKVANDHTSTSTSMTSTNPDAGVGLGKGSTPRPSPKAHPASIIRLQDVRNHGIEPHKYSVVGNEFGVQICAAWGYVTYEGGEYVNEVAHWAALYDDPDHGLMSLPPDQQGKAKAKLLRICGVVRAHPNRYENPAAYLERVAQNAIRDQKRARKKQSG